jgi:hypothetical protein
MEVQRKFCRHICQTFSPWRSATPAATMPELKTYWTSAITQTAEM